jgi:O-acetyl-ADP-ribose deacetylase (regulator of RNase III)
MIYQEIEGNLITLAKEGKFDVIAHGCNCYCNMGAGIAPQMANAFGCDKFTMERDEHKGDVNKLGTIDYEHFPASGLAVVNAYTQYDTGFNRLTGSKSALDYEALTLCLRKMNFTFDSLHIGLPQIGCGLAGGDWEIVKEIIQKELKDCDVTIVIYKP